MNRNLANYIFLSETLYQSPTEKIMPEVSVSVIKKPAEVSQEITQTAVITTPTKKIETPTFQMNTKHLVVVKNLQAAEQEMLGKILNAIDLNLDFVDLLDVSQYPEIDFKTLIYGNMPKAILYFGPESGGEFLTKLRLEIYSPKTLKEIKFLVADSLSQILLNVNNEKRKLWEALKVVFDK